jgi:hypothetical protein
LFTAAANGQVLAAHEPLGLLRRVVQAVVDAGHASDLIDFPDLLDEFMDNPPKPEYRRPGIDLEDGPIRKLTFHVERWTDDGNELVEILAAAVNIRMTQGAHEVALTQRPKSTVPLRQRGRVIEERGGKTCGELNSYGRTISFSPRRMHWPSA